MLSIARRAALTLAWMLVLGAGSVIAADEGLRGDDDASVMSLGKDPQARIEELTLRMQGMEGKLRDSAAARKSAEQARMEAERRLAEASQETARFDAEISLLRDTIVALETRLNGAEARAAQAAQGQAEAERDLRRLIAERDAQGLRCTGLEHQLEQLTRAQQRSDEAHQERLRTLLEEKAALKTSLAARDAELSRTQADLRAVEAERDGLSSRLDACRDNMPANESGHSISNLDQMRALAADAAAAIRKSRAQVDQDQGTHARRAVLDGERRLHRSQSSLARVTGARAVYRVRPNDSLAQIAFRFYGDSARSEEIGAANQYVLESPDQLTPGMTLVIP